MAMTFFVVGPTGVGKSELAAEIAARFEAEIIGADAFQIYEGLDLLTAKPSRETLARVPHHLIGEIPLSQAFDVAQYLNAARRRISEIQTRGKRVLVVGGTGLYIRALTHGLAKLPSADANLREELERQPLAELQSRLAHLDPAAAATIDVRNPRRLIRAIEICLLTGQPFSNFRDQWQRSPPNLRGVILTRDRSELHARIEQRTEAMFVHGVVDEVVRAGDIGPSAAQMIGLREIRSLLAGEISREHCIRLIQAATRQYAKRQLTWFRREKAFEMVDLGPGVTAQALIDRLDW